MHCKLTSVMNVSVDGASVIRSVGVTFFMSASRSIFFSKVRFLFFVLTLKVLVTTIDAQWEGMEDVR